MSTDYSGIGSLNEKSLHRQLKDLYLQAGCVQEHLVGSYYVDVRTHEKLIEIQTGSFSSMKKKLNYLLKDHKVLLVHPVTAEKYITTLEEDEQTIRSRRKSPKKQGFHHAAGQLMYIYTFLDHPNFACELLLTEEEEIRIDDGQGSWRRKGVSLSDRVLIKIRGKKSFTAKEDYLSLLPEGLPERFTNNDLGKLVSGTKRDTGKLSYLLKKLELIECVEKKGNSQVFMRLY
ncbi:MAG: hypothetical protein JEY99_02165 [Spirochaetales bacterium]|nr:hypothetical protein [Spirochaetales bacterium]